MAGVILAARGLAYRYPGGARGLRGIDLEVPRGLRLALLGANGAGKSTLLLHLNGTLRPERGEVHLSGRAMGYGRADLAEWRRRVGLVLQDPDDQLFSASVYQDVSFGPLNLGLAEGAARERVEEALAAMEIGDLRDRPTHLLSFGQKKRAAIAGVLAMRPEVLLLDEPMAGLDPEGAERLLDLLERLHRAGTTLVLATHDLDLARSWADEAVVLHEGTVVGRGAPGRVLQDAALVARARLRRTRAPERGCAACPLAGSPAREGR